MTYRETTDYLFNQLPVFQKEGASAYKPGLDTIRELDKLFGHPHLTYPCIHVAGTNGKGSVSHLTASVLQEAGMKVGLFTSPHLVDFRERIRVDGAMIPERAVVNFVEKFLVSWAGTSGEMPSSEKKHPLTKEQTTIKIKPSFFELTTMMALSWFEEQEVDVAVIEVGLGGRLDSTNIIRPIVSVITNIGLDHMALLGDNLNSIAGEKAGIIKSGVPVVVGRADDSVREVFIRKAEACSSPLVIASDIYSVTGKLSGSYTLLDVCEWGKKIYDDLPCALNGWYQMENTATVLTLLRQLPASWLVSEQVIRDGFRNVLRNTGLRGRWETLSTDPRIICDTGHNEDGIRYVVRQLQQTPHENLHVIIGMVSDKDYHTVLSLLPKDATYYFTQASIPRALSVHELAQAAAGFGLKGSVYPTVKAALESAKKTYRPNDLIFVGGSTFVVAEAI